MAILDITVRPQEIPEPFTEVNQTRYQTRRHKVRCEYCKYETWTELVGARCGKCKQFLITVIESVMPQTNELA